MTSEQAVRRLLAFSAGKPLPHGTTLRVPTPNRSLGPKDVLVVAFVRMGGESSPWGIAFGQPGRTPKVLTVPEARTRDDVADMIASFAPVLLTHLRHPKFDSAGAVITEEKRPDMPLRQLWLPNRSHLDMLHYLAYTYHRTRYGTPERQELLQSLARACGWLFREAHRPGQMVTMIATDVLSEAYTFPTDDIRQGHLGFLVAWLTTRGRQAVRVKAADKAEGLSMSTNLDPIFENTGLAKAVDAFNEARSNEDVESIKRWTQRIHKSLNGELKRRWELTDSAITALEHDRRRENYGVKRLIKASQDEYYRQYLRIEHKFEDIEDGPPFTPSPETDRHPAAAGSRYYVHLSSDELQNQLLVHDDPEMQAELIATGKALDGEIVDVSTRTEGRKEHVFWKIHTNGHLPLRLREGALLCPVGNERRQGEILQIDQLNAQTNRFVLQIIKGKTLHEPPKLIRANDRALLGSRVILVPPPMDGIARRKSRSIWNRKVPGSWLTHSTPRGPNTSLPDAISEDFNEIKSR